MSEPEPNLGNSVTRTANIFGSDNVVQNIFIINADAE